MHASQHIEVFLFKLLGTSERIFFPIFKNIYIYFFTNFFFSQNGTEIGPYLELFGEGEGLK